MRIPSGVTDQYIYFVAVDATDFSTRETGLSSFTVYRSRNGGASAAMTTPTINETDTTNMPGVYELLLDEDMTIDSGDDSQEMVFHITHAGMAPVTRTIELYRPKITAGNTLGVASDGDISGNVDGAVASVTGAVGSVTGAVGSISGVTFPTNFADLAITATTGKTTVGTNDDKTGYSISGTKTTLDALNDIAATSIVSAGAITTSGGAVSTVTSVTNQVTADCTAISGDSTAADNLEATFDGSGYTDDNAPAKQSQVSNLTNVGSAVNFAASSYVLTTGTQSSGTYVNTAPLDGVYHTHTDTAGAIDYYYQFAIASSIPASCKLTGYVNGGNDSVGIYGYDWDAAGWVQIGTIQGSSSTSNQVFSFDLYTDMVGSGADIGKVRIRVYAASGLSSATVAIDQIFVSVNASIEGYAMGAIWFDSSLSNTNTVPGVDGVARNPVSSLAAVNTLISSTNLKNVQVVPGSSLTLNATLSGVIVDGHGYTLALGGQDIDNSHFLNCSVSGIGTSSTESEFHYCEFSTASIQKAHCYTCGFDGTVTHTLAGDYNYIDCYSKVAGSGSPTFTKTSLQTVTAQFRRWSGGITISGLESGDVISLEGVFGTITLNGADAQVEIRGTYKALTNNLTGSPTVNDYAVSLSNINTEVLDVINVDTYAEPGQGAPSATATLAAKLNYLYKAWRNKSEQTSTTYSLYDDAGTTVDQKSTVSDNGTTATKGEIVTGP